jgi:DNA-binding transcriptional regulator YdaS (Cro superfamily)
MADPRTASQIIDALGGTKAVSVALGCSMPVVSNWRKAKIPPERWPGMVAAFAGDITYEELAAQVPPIEDEAAA